MGYTEIILWQDGSNASGRRKPRALDDASTRKDSGPAPQAMDVNVQEPALGEPDPLGEKPEVRMNEDGSITVG